MNRESASVIVVGVDGSPGGNAALVFALSEAARTGDAVEVVTAWEAMMPALWDGMASAGASPAARAAVRRHAEQVQQQALQGVAVPTSVVVSTQLVEGAAGPVLVEAARRGRLLVVGNKSIGSLHAGVLGSVSRYCAHHATGSVVVVPASVHRAYEHQEQSLVPAESSAPPDA